MPVTKAQLIEAMKYMDDDDFVYVGVKGEKDWNTRIFEAETISYNECCEQLYGGSWRIVESNERWGFETHGKYSEFPVVYISIETIKEEFPEEYDKEN